MNTPAKYALARLTFDILNDPECRRGWKGGKRKRRGARNEREGQKPRREFAFVSDFMGSPRLSDKRSYYVWDEP